MSKQFVCEIDSSSSIIGVAQSTEATSLGLLSAIDGTVDAMLGIAQVMAGFTKMLSSITRRLSERKVVENDYADPDDVALEAIGRSIDHLNTFLPRLVRKRATIDKDSRLKEHHCESLHDAYEQAMNEVAELIDALQCTKSAIIQHDLAAEPRGTADTFETVDRLIESLRNQ